MVSGEGFLTPDLVDAVLGFGAALLSVVSVVIVKHRRSEPPSPPPQTWPTSTDYSEAVGNPASAFPDPQLRAARVDTDMLGLPGVASGQNAVVFRLNIDGEVRALRCFVAEPHDGPSRYQALQQHLRDNPCPDVVAPQWVDAGIRVGDRHWPVVMMPWVGDAHLDTAVADLRDTPERIRTLADNWQAAVERLEASGLVHGDLQHGNVLVDTDLALQLIDLDGAWVPGGTAAAPNETGHPNYQHPRRTRAHWGPGIDSFSSLLIYLSLRALAAEPSLLWFSSDEGLLFVRDDLERPGHTPVWGRLDRSPDPEVPPMAALLADLCRAPEPPRAPLAELLVEAERRWAVPGSPVGAPVLPALPGLAGDLWWEERGLPVRDPENLPLVPPAAAGDAWWHEDEDGHLAASDGKAVGA